MTDYFAWSHDASAIVNLSPTPRNAALAAMTDGELRAALVPLDRTDCVLVALEAPADLRERLLAALPATKRAHVRARLDKEPA